MDVSLAAEGRHLQAHKVQSFSFEGILNVKIIGIIITAVFVFEIPIITHQKQNKNGKEERYYPTKSAIPQQCLRYHPK